MAQLTPIQVQKLLVLWLLATANPKSAANPGGIDLNDPNLLTQVRTKVADNGEDPAFVSQAMAIFNGAAQNNINMLSSTSQDMTNFITSPAANGTALTWGVGPQCPAGPRNILGLFP
jgi:hypothetical protein